jgi:hypothetical protein
MTVATIEDPAVIQNSTGCVATLASTARQYTFWRRRQIV